MFKIKSLNFIKYVFLFTMNNISTSIKEHVFVFFFYYFKGNRFFIGMKIFNFKNKIFCDF